MDEWDSTRKLSSYGLEMCRKCKFRFDCIITVAFQNHPKATVKKRTISLFHTPSWRVIKKGVIPSQFECLKNDYIQMNKDDVPLFEIDKKKVLKAMGYDKITGEIFENKS
jgi:hypothetical protein